MKILLPLFLAIGAYAQVPCNGVNLFLNPKWGYAGMALTGDNTRWSHHQKQMPIYNQGKTGICYAYTAAQMVDYWRQTMGIRASSEILLSSPLYAALLSRMYEKGAKFNEKGLSAGHTQETLEAIRKMGMCREDVIRRRINIFSKENKMDQREFLELLEIIFSTYGGSYLDLEKMNTMEIYKKFIHGKIPFYDKRKINTDGKIALLLKKIAPFIKNGDLTKFMKELLAECLKPQSIYVGSKNIPDPISVNIGPEHLEEDGGMENFIRSLLMSPKAQPIGVSYCSKFLNKRNYEGVNKDLSLAPDCGTHASILMGMQEIGGKCHYLLRNTWGSGCSYAWKCKFNAKNEATGIWVEEKSLIKNLNSFVYLKNKDLFCLAKNQSYENYFELDVPSFPYKNRQVVQLFEDNAVLISKAYKDSIEFLYGKNISGVYNFIKTKNDDLLKKSFNASFEYPKEKMEIKLACVPNGGTKSELQMELKELITGEFICLAKTMNGESFFEINEPSYPFHQNQYRNLSGGSDYLRFNTDATGNITISYGFSTDKMYIVEKISAGSLKLPLTSKFSFPRQKMELNLACIKNGSDEKKLKTALKNLIPGSRIKDLTSKKGVLCLAQTPYQEEYFSMNIPSHPSHSLQQLNIFQNQFLLEVEAGSDGSVTFHYGKDKDHLHLIKTVDKMSYPHRIKFAFAPGQLNLKLACGLNKSNENKLKMELKRLNSSKDILCMARTPWEINFFELDNPNHSAKKIQKSEIFGGSQNIFLVKEDESINFKYGKNLSNADLIESFPGEKIQMPIKGKIFNPEKNIDLEIACLENDPLNKNLTKELRNFSFQKDLICIIQSPVGKDVFEIDNPVGTIQENEVINHSGLVTVGLENGKVNFKFGKNKDSLEIVGQVDPKKINSPDDLKLNPAKGVKIGCLNNRREQNLVKRELEKILNKKRQPGKYPKQDLLCLGRSYNKEEFFEIKNPASFSTEQIVNLFRDSRVLSVSPDNNGKIIYKYGRNLQSLKIMRVIEAKTLPIRLDFTDNKEGVKLLLICDKIGSNKDDLKEKLRNSLRQP